MKRSMLARVSSSMASSPSVNGRNTTASTISLRSSGDGIVPAQPGLQFLEPGIPVRPELGSQAGQLGPEAGAVARGAPDRGRDGFRGILRRHDALREIAS